MKNTIFLDSNFNFLLLECEESERTKIIISVNTSDAANQRFEISTAGGAVVTVDIDSDFLVNFELPQRFWADNNITEITPKNDDVTGETITINFPRAIMSSAALNYIDDHTFDFRASDDESGAESGSGSGGSGYEFVETIRNIGFRLLDEPENVNAYFNNENVEVNIKWTDPADIATNEPVPCAWAGTIVVRKEGSAPLHKWDGTLIIDSTTRDEYASTALIDNSIEVDKTYYYGIFPYYVAIDDPNNPIKYYRFTKVVSVDTTMRNDFSFDYSGEIQTFTAPKDGVYKLEVWGAQGGTADDGENTTASGGYGSYSVGEVELHQGDTLYIGVGGQGGYNGGGAGN